MFRMENRAGQIRNNEIGKRGLRGQRGGHNFRTQKQWRTAPYNRGILRNGDGSPKIWKGKNQQWTRFATEETEMQRETEKTSDWELDEIRENVVHNNYMNKKVQLEAIMELEDMISPDVMVWKYVRKYAVGKLQEILEKSKNGNTRLKLRGIIRKVESSNKKWTEELKELISDVLLQNCKPEFLQ